VGLVGTRVAHSGNLAEELTGLPRAWEQMPAGKKILLQLTLTRRTTHEPNNEKSAACTHYVSTENLSFDATFTCEK